MTVEISNQAEPDYTSLKVTKKWYNGDNEITGDALNDLEAEVELVRYRAEPTGTTVHFINVKQNSDLATLVIPRSSSGESISVSIDSISGGANATLFKEFNSSMEMWQLEQQIPGNKIDSWGYIQSVGTKRIQTVDANDIYVVFDGGIQSITVSTEAVPDSGDATIDPTFDSTQHRQTLNSGNDFTYTYPKLLKGGKGTDDGKTYIYSYGIREVSNPNGFAFNTYIDAGINEADPTEGIKASNPTTDVIVKNVKTEPETGALKLKKIVTVNGGDNGSSTLTDGTYHFTIESTSLPAGEKVTKTVDLTFRGGQITNAKVDNSEVSVEADGYVIVQDLPEGPYTITETEPTNGTSISKINDEDTSEYSTTVTVVAGDTTAAQANAVFTNNFDITTTTVEATKAWKSGTQTVVWPSDVESVEFTLYAKISGMEEAVAISDSSISSFFTDVDATQSITKNTANKKAEWTDLPSMVSDGGTWKTVEYSVIETKVTYTEAAKQKATEEGLTLVDLTTAQAIAEAYSNPSYAQDSKTITNELPKIPVTATKQWSDNKTTHPTIWFKLFRTSGTHSISEVEGAEIKELPSGTTSVTWTGMDKYDSEGNEYVYSVKEVKADGSDFVPEGYEKQEKGLTVINTPRHDYNPKTSYIGTKTWNDADNINHLRPDDLTVTLYADGEPLTLEGQPVWTNKNTNTWTYTFSELPVFAADGHAISYTAEETEPANYTRTGKEVTNTAYVIGDFDEKGKVTTCEPTDFKLSDSLNLGVVFIKPTAGDATIIWTQRVPTESEKIVLTAKADAYFGTPVQFANGLPYVYHNTQHSDRTATITMTDDGIHLRFTHKSVWSQFAYGEYNATYTEGTTSFTNTDGSASVPVTADKTMKGGEAPDAFRFTLTAVDGAPMPAGTNSPLTVENITNETSEKEDKSDVGTVSFGTINYTKEDMKTATEETGEDGAATTAEGYASEKTFTYTIQEVLPEDAAADNNYTIDGVRYDPVIYTVNVKVTYDSTTGEMKIASGYPQYSKQTGDSSAPADSISFENEKFKNFEFTKIWRKADGSGNDEWGDKSITVILHRKVNGAEESTGDYPKTITLAAEQSAEGKIPVWKRTGDAERGYKFVFYDLEAYDGNGNAYEYSVTEGPVDNYKTDYTYPEGMTTQEVLNEACDKGKIINTPVDAVTLPHTGGIGTKLFTILGTALICFAGAALLLRRRRTIR